LQLLVSVRHPDEVRPALEGGADIIDAKEPASGALGAVRGSTLALILKLVPDRCAFSAALGDPTEPLEADALVAALPLTRRSGRTYVKLGFAGVSGWESSLGVLRAACDAAERHPARPRVIAVAYADRKAGPDLDGTVELAADAGARGVLVDTFQKEGGTLLDAIPPARLTGWVARARRAGLLVALAGRLDRDALVALSSTGAHVVGVRGAACEGGRMGRVSAAKVRSLRDALAGIAEDRPPPAKHQTPGLATDRATSPSS
jgi:uncharacterized protein (UPF0264 family)